jgi:alpha-mannosidase
VHDDRNITEARIDRVFNERVRGREYTRSLDLDVRAWEVPGEPVPVEQAAVATYEDFVIGGPFARPWGTTWFQLEATIPESWAGEHVQVEIHLAYSDMPGFTSEGLLWRRATGDDAAGDDGVEGDWVPWRGVHPAAHHVTVAAPAVGGERIELLLEAASNPSIIEGRPDPNSDLDTAGASPIHRLASARLVVRDDELHALVHDVLVVRNLMRQLTLENPQRHELLRGLEAAIEAIDLEDVPGSAPAARAALAPVLARPAPASAHRVSAVGHAHIDTAWLWPLRETRRKCARTFSNVLALMDEFDDFIFCCSQAVQYEWMLEDYPTVFEGIRRRVAEGRWVPVGGMWVEADTNLAGGEALLRQFTHGQRFFREHFDLECTEVWIPDVFGYPASLPGIMAHAGLHRFLTQKLSWNQTNRFPHQTFWWEGIDGSTVFTHFPPVETYNATFAANELVASVRNHAERGRASRSLMPFGWGDGGGGPSPDQLETYVRSRDLDGFPRLEMSSPEAFFDAAIEEYPDAPRWVGELYLEMHRGTLTSQAGTKQGNRRCELLLREAELWWATAATSGGAGEDYPAEQLDRLWKVVLVHQFHDILPGSSIGWVHREAEAAYAAVAEELEALIAEALGRLAAGPGVANAAPHARDEVVVVPASTPGLDGSPGQTLGDGNVAVRVAAPAGGVAALVPLDPAGAVSVERGPAGLVIGNGLVAAVLDGSGLLVSLVDERTGRELVPEGERGNRLEIHPDFPNSFDAWDIEHFNRRKVTALDGPAEIEVLDEGPMLARVRVARSFRSSTVVQVLELRAGSARLDVDLEVDWAEQEQLLQVAFPLDVNATDMTREIQFGHLRTPIHTNTSWDFARFEVCAHRWVDVSEPGAGMALLNDSRYGHHAERVRSAADEPITVLYQTLLRGSRYPDPRQDQGVHRCTYSLLVHAGDLRAAGVIDEGYRLNLPMRVVDGGTAAVRPSPVVTVDHPAVVVEAVKLADDGSGDVVVRLYEAHGGRARVTVTPGFPVADVVATDAHERVGVPARCPDPIRSGDGVALEFRPFQIATLRFSRS